ncbi:hypothetical protein SLA2020_433450 [Shorea laevis]
MMESGLETGDACGSVACCGSGLHELWTSPGSVLGSVTISSSLLLFWSEDEETAGGREGEMSSENVDINW